MEKLKEHNITHCVVAIGYERNMTSLSIRVGDYVLTDQDFAAYDRLTGEIPLPHASSTLLPTKYCSLHSAAVECSGEAHDSNVCSMQESCSESLRSEQQVVIPRGQLFGGGIAFPQDLIDGGGNREPWVGFKRSVEQVDLMVDAFGKGNCPSSM